MRQGLFRQAALERLASPERLDELMGVTSPKSWLSLLGLGGVLVAALFWAVFGSVPVLLHADGILIRAGSVRIVEAPAAGALQALLVGTGDEVQQGQMVAQLVEAG